MALQDVLNDLVQLIDTARARGTINTPHGYLYVIKAEELDAWIEKAIADADDTKKLVADEQPPPING